MVQTSTVTTIPAREAPPRSESGLAQRAFAEIRDHFPVWFILCLSGGHVLSALAFVQPPRYAAMVTAIFPLFWVAVYYRIGRANDARLDRPLIVALCVAAVVLTLLAWLPARAAWNPADPSAVRSRFEVLAILWVSLLLLHCLRDRGWPSVAMFFPVGAIYGFLLENGGISLGYFSEAGYRYYVPFSRTPISSVAGWCTVFYPSVFIAEKLIARTPSWRSRVFLSAALVTAIAISSDLHFDHLATALGMWTWNPRLPAAFLGVPLVNFTSWLTAVFAFAVLYFLFERRAWSATSKVAVALLGIPIVLGIAGVANLMLIGILEGFSGPSWTIFREALR